MGVGTAQICDGVMWNLLGEGINCEVDNCGKPAYQICDQKFEQYVGCGRKMCLDHCDLKIRKGRKKKDNLMHYNCKDAVCFNNCETQWKEWVAKVQIPVIQFREGMGMNAAKMAMIPLGIYFAVSIVIIIVVIVVSNQ